MTKYFFVTFISIFLFGCFESNTVLARVNNKTLKQSDLKYLNIDKKNQEQFIHEWVKLQLLASSVKENPIINLKANFNKAKMKANIFVSNLLKNKEINKEDLLNYYKVNYQNFYEVVPKYKFQKIYVSTKKKKNIIINKISENTGIKFSDLAKDYSEDIFGKNGGYTGFVDKSVIRDNVWNKVINSPKNQYVWVDVPDGYVIARWYDSKDFKIQQSFDKVREKIRQILIKQNRENLLNQELEKLKKENKVEINLKNI